LIDDVNMLVLAFEHSVQNLQFNIARQIIFWRPANAQL